MGISSYLPRNHLDATAMGFTFLMIPTSYLHGVLYIAPTIWPTSSASNLPPETASENATPYYTVVALMTFLFVNTFANLVLTVTTDTSCGRIPLPVVEQPGWHFCPYCRYHAPPRAHHCPTCRSCVLRRDHHCFFAGKCVGIYNHRYFVAFLIYLTASAVCGVVTSFLAISQLAGGFSISFIPAFIFPVLGWIFQMMPVNPFVMLEASLAMIVTVGASFLVGLQLYMIARGQTYHELQKGVHIYGRSMRENFADVLGKNWWFCWILPFIPSPLPGDGAHYPPRDQVDTKWNVQGGLAGQGKRKNVKST